MKIKFLDNEYWYGGAAHLGHKLPVSAEGDLTIDLITGAGIADQYSPLFISNKGRYIYGKEPFVIHFSKGIIEITGTEKVELSEGHKNLKGAQMAVVEKYFALDGLIPDTAFFKAPQFNTWIELMYNQNEAQILEYAESLLETGIAPGVLMIDEGWAPDYGDFDFCARKFKDPKGMVGKLHDMGFYVMLWVVPFISPDSNCYRKLRDTDYLVRDRDGEFAVRKWWNGYSCVLDLSNPKACEWFKGKLDGVMEKYGVDGFKFDAGGAYFYKSDDTTYIRQASAEHTRSFDAFSSGYKFNELRCVWDMGGKPIVCRLQDKAPAWKNSGDMDLGLESLIPNMLTQGILGYFYGCPDMIGGGGYASFLEKGYKTDEELYVRWLETSLLCPMLQFSVSPKRILSKEGFDKVSELVKKRREYTSQVLELAKNASVTGEPVMRYLEYEFPDEGFEAVTDMFMLGDKLLVAPVTKQGADKRSVKLPKGVWKYLDGTEYIGGKTVEVSAPLGTLPVFIYQGR